MTILLILIWLIVAIVLLSVQIYKLKIREEGFKVEADELGWAVTYSVFWFVFVTGYIISIPLDWIFKKVGGKILNWLNK